MEKLIGEGAEAKLILRDNNILVKQRMPKTHRVKELDDKIRKFRSKREFKVLTKLFESKINVPKPIKIDEKKFEFEFEYLKGKVLKDALDEKFLREAFEQIILMHKNGVVHGDLTTLNMILKDDKVFIIDFGLSEFSDNVEERAVDLNLFFLCIKNEHNELFYLKEKLIEIYEKEFGNLVIERLHKVEMRGRNKNS